MGSGWRLGTSEGIEQALNCNLLNELEVDAPSYRKYMRMDQHHFQDLMTRVAPAIARQNTNFHDAISVGERLALTLRFLATGMCFVRSECDMHWA